ncbi:hypothetical protein B0H16DRAFT_1876726, partial [Mycena metata]
MKSLPFELLAAIFLAFHDTNPQESPRSMSALITISQVFRRWRAIAHQTTALWTHIALIFHTEEKYSRLRELIVQWAARSHPRPLSVTIRSCYPDSHNPAIAFLLSNAPRIQKLCLALPATHFHPLLQSPAGLFTQLDTLTLAVIAKVDTVHDPSLGLTRSQFFDRNPYYSKGGEPDGILWDAIRPQITVIGNLPLLRKITIDSGDLNDLDAGMFPVFWGNLTHINLGSVPLGVHGTALILPLCVSAEVLCFATSDMEEDDLVPIILPFKLPLTSLEWVGFDVDPLTIFEPLILPYLTSLKLRDACEETIRDLHQRSSFALQRLSPCFVYLSLLPLSTFLRDMPSLTCVELYHCIIISDAFLVLLTNNRPGILPRLQTLIICDKERHFTESAMLQMVESRWYSTPLAKIRISTRQEVHEAAGAAAAHRRILHRIAELIEEGLDFEYDLRDLVLELEPHGHVS